MKKFLGYIGIAVVMVVISVVVLAILTMPCYAFHWPAWAGITWFVSWLVAMIAAGWWIEDKVKE